MFIAQCPVAEHDNHLLVHLPLICRQGPQRQLLVSGLICFYNTAIKLDCPIHPSSSGSSSERNLSSTALWSLKSLLLKDRLQYGNSQDSCMYPPRRMVPRRKEVLIVVRMKWYPRRFASLIQKLFPNGPNPGGIMIKLTWSTFLLIFLLLRNTPLDPMETSSKRFSAIGFNYFLFALLACGQR